MSDTKAARDQDSDYESAEDADFHDSDAFSNGSSDESDVPKRKNKTEKDLDSGDEVTIAKQKKRRNGADTGDLILTRAQKRVKADEAKPVIKGPIGEDKPEDLDELWKQLNSKPAAETTSVAVTSTPSSDTVKIKRSYEFAGQLVTEEKEVPKDSAEAKAYFSSIYTSNTPIASTKSAKPVARRPVKRKSNLEEMAKGNKPAKLNVLEKSRLDWAGFVDKEGIHDDLKRFNKDGYVERQEFLKRTR